MTKSRSMPAVRWGRLFGRRRGWFRNARIAWEHTRVFKWTWYGSDRITCCTCWVECENGALIAQRGLFADADELQRMHKVMAGGFWTARRYMLRKMGKLYVIKVTDDRPNIGGEGRAASARTSPPPCSAVPMTGETP